MNVATFSTSLPATSAAGCCFERSSAKNAVGRSTPCCDLKSQHGVDLPTAFFALDRSKQQPAALVAGKDVEKVATFIYYRGDRELGRIVERPQAVLEDDLLALAAKP